MRRLGVVLLLIAAATMVNSGRAGAAQGGTDRPFRCVSVGSATFDNEIHAFVHEDRVNCAHLGLLGPSRLDASGFVYTWVAANGDELLVHPTSIVLEPTADPLTFWVNAVGTIDGGTGRFANASGVFADTGPETYFPGVPLHYTYELTFTGTFSY